MSWLLLFLVFDYGLSLALWGILWWFQRHMIPDAPLPVRRLFQGWILISLGFLGLYGGIAYLFRDWLQ